MTIEEFDKTKFTGGQKGKYRGKEYPIVSVDFQEKLVGIIGYWSPDDEEPYCVRCENIELIPQ